MRILLLVIIALATSCNLGCATAHKKTQGADVANADGKANAADVARAEEEAMPEGPLSLEESISRTGTFEGKAIVQIASAHMMGDAIVVYVDLFDPAQKMLQSTSTKGLRSANTDILISVLSGGRLQENFLINSRKVPYELPPTPPLSTGPQMADAPTAITEILRTEDGQWRRCRVNYKHPPEIRKGDRIAFNEDFAASAARFLSWPSRVHLSVLVSDETVIVR